MRQWPHWDGTGGPRHDARWLPFVLQARPVESVTSVTLSEQEKVIGRSSEFCFR